MTNISVGSACSNGGPLSSHVLQALGASGQRANIRFSFSKFNTLDEIHQVVAKVAELCAVKVLA